MTTLGFDVFWRDHGASRGMKGLGDDTHKTSGKFSTFKTVAASAGLIAGAAIFKLGKDSVKAFTEAETSQTKLQDAFKRFPKLTDVTIGSLRNLNTQLAQKTKFDDDAFASGQAVLAQFGLTGKQLTNMTPLLADYAAKTGKDLPTAAKTLGKAFLGNTRALKDLGIAYKPTGDKAKDMAAIQQLVNEKVGGFAEEQGKTAAGQAEILGNQFGELEETVGSKLVPAMLALVGVGITVVGFLQRNSDIMGPLALGIAGVVIGVKAWNVAQGLLNNTMRSNVIGLIVFGLITLGVWLVHTYKTSERFRDIVNGVFRVVGIGALELAKAFIRFGKFAFDAIWTWVLTPLRLMLTVMSKLPLGMGKPFAAAKKTLDGFKKSADSTFNSAINKVDAWERTLKNAPKVAKLKGDIKDLESKLATAKHKLLDKDLTKERRARLNANIAALQAKIRIAQGAINSLHGKTVTIAVNLALQAAGGNWEVLRGIAGRQHGGPVTAGMPYRVGERGPELFIPNTSGWIKPSVSSMARVSGQGGTTINIQNATFNGVQNPKQLATELRKFVRGAGGNVQRVLGS